MSNAIVKVFRVRVTPEVGYWEQCGLLALTPPENGFCQVYQHPRKDLSKAKAEELKARILDAGQIDLRHWEHWGQIEADRVL